MAPGSAAWRIARCVIVLGAALWISALTRAEGNVSGTPDTSAQAELPASLPLRREPASASSGGSWLTASGALALLALGGTVMVGRRRGWRWLLAGADVRQQAGPVRTASQALTAQASIHAVRWNGEELLLGCTAQQVTVLARRPLPLEQGHAP